MRIFIDLDSNKVIEAPGVTAEITELRFKRAAQATLEVQFIRGSAISVVELPGDANGVFGVKVVGEYDSDFVTAGEGWIKSGAGTSTVYSFIFTLETTELDTLFFVDADPANDVAQLTFMCEVEWTTGGKTFKTPTLSFLVDNDVVRGDESPIDLPPVAFGIYFEQGQQAIGTGVDFIAVVFSPAFPAGSEVNVLASVQKTNDVDDNIFATIRGSTVDENGFTADLSTATGDTTHKLNWFAVASPP